MGVLQSLLINSANSAQYTTLTIWYCMKIHLRLNIPYLWDITPCWLVYRYHRFGGSNYVHLQGSRRRVAARSKPLGVVALFSAQPVFVVHRGIWKEATVDLKGILRGERMWEKSGANDLLSRYPQETLEWSHCRFAKQVCAPSCCRTPFCLSRLHCCAYRRFMRSGFDWLFLRQWPCFLLPPTPLQLRNQCHLHISHSATITTWPCSLHWLPKCLAESLWVHTWSFRSTKILQRVSHLQNLGNSVVR
jgi:hypothetical protein